MTDFPDAPTLEARGKYATVRSLVRARTKELRDRLEKVNGQARIVLQFNDSPPDMASTYAAMQRQMENVGDCIAHLAELHAELDELRPAAWGKEKNDE